MRDQEQLRMSTPLASTGTVLATCAALGFATLATLSAAVPAGNILLPVFTSAIFISCSTAESTCTRAKGIARYNSGQACTIAAQQEEVLAEAEARKAFLPFGVGFTAICAAACVCLRIFNVRIVDLMPEDEINPPLFATDNFIAFVLAFGSVAGAIATSDYALRMHTAIAVRSGSTDRDSLRLPKFLKEPRQVERLRIGTLTVLGCLLPLPFATAGFSLSPVSAKEFQTIFDQCSVFVSATAAAGSALVFLFAEKEFCDAERRVAEQSKQGALASLFFSQAQAEAAMTPMRSAFGGVALGGATLAVEFSGIVAALFPWPAMMSAFRSILTTNLAKTEADATWLERRMPRRARGWARRVDGISSTSRELQRIYQDLFSPNLASTSREKMRRLAIGQDMEFRGLAREGRRNIHLSAAELGLLSQSRYMDGQTVVVVTNTRLQGEEDTDDEDSKVNSNFFEELWKETREMVSQGIPQESFWLVIPAFVATSGSLATPFVASKTVADLVLPFVTGGVALLAVSRERIGKEAVAAAKGPSAKIQRREAEAESLLGLALLAISAVPTYVAIGTCATVTSCVSFMVPGSLLRWTSALAFFVMLLLTCATLRRVERIRKYVAGAARLVEAPCLPAGPSRLGLLLPVLAFLLPIDWPRRLTIASAGFSIYISMAFAYSSKCLAAGEFYAARCGRVFARADAWAQVGARASRALPLGSAAAIVNTLLATALVTVSTPVGTLFPIIALGVSVRALQYSLEAQEDAANVDGECMSAQAITARPPPWLSEEGLALSFTLAEAPLPESLKPKRNEVRKTLWQKFHAFWLDFRKLMSKAPAMLIRAFDENGPEELYSPSPAERVVQSVQADLDELRVSVRANEKNWLRTGAIVGLCATAAIVSPLVLPHVLTEVLLPVVGASLTIFAVSAESDSRRSVAVSKIWTAELGEVAFTAEELVCTTQLYKTQLVSLAGASAMLGVIALVLEHPWSAGPAAAKLGILRHSMQVVLVVSGAICSAQSARRALTVCKLAENVFDATAENLRASLNAVKGESPTKFLGVNRPRVGAGAKMKKRDRRILSMVAILPSLILAVFPLNRSFGRRAVASVSAAALVVGVALYVAEQASTRAERFQSSQLRTFALADIFSNEAEQQGALLPLTSAATIAFSALITFATELNPYTASALTLLQAVAWIVASRKAVATKFESAAALQVNSVSLSREARMGEGKPTQRLKRYLIRDFF